jgi:ribosomal protein L37AE/L43A
MNKNLQKYKQVDDKYECPKCGKLYSKFGIGIHTWRAHGDGKEFAPRPQVPITEFIKYGIKV